MSLDIASLEASSSFWGRVDVVGVVLVIIGCVGEGISEWPPKRLINWGRIHSLGRASWLVLVAGLVIELGAQFEKDGFDSLMIAELRDHTESLRSDNLKLERQIQPRRLSSSDIAAIAKSITPFSKEGVAFESYASDGEAYAFGSQLERQIQPRRLSSSDIAAIAKSITPFSKEGVAFESYASDGEAYAFGSQLADAFGQTGISVDPGGLLTKLPSKPVAWGILVSGEDLNLVDAIISSLKSAGFAAEAGYPNGGGLSFSVTSPLFRPQATVFVGMKPLTPKAP